MYQLTSLALSLGSNLNVNELFQKHIQKVKFHPPADIFTQALQVMHVTNITSVCQGVSVEKFGVVGRLRCKRVNIYDF